MSCPNAACLTQLEIAAQDEDEGEDKHDDEEKSEVEHEDRDDASMVRSPHWGQECLVQMLIV